MNNQQHNIPEMLTPAEVGRAFRVHPKVVTRWADKGHLRFIRTLGGHRRFFADEVRALLQQPGDPR